MLRNEMTTYTYLPKGPSTIELIIKDLEAVPYSRTQHASHINDLDDGWIGKPQQCSHLLKSVHNVTRRMPEDTEQALGSKAVR